MGTSHSPLAKAVPAVCLLFVLFVMSGLQALPRYVSPLGCQRLLELATRHRRRLFLHISLVCILDLFALVTAIVWYGRVICIYMYVCPFSSAWGEHATFHTTGVNNVACFCRSNFRHAYVGP